MKDVPTGVRIIACLCIASSVLMLMMLVFSWPALTKDHEPPITFLVATVVFPLLLIWVGVGLYQLRRWAWWIAMVLITLSLLADLLGLRSGSGLLVALLKLVLRGLILWYLWKPSTRTRFK